MIKKVLGMVATIIIILISGCAPQEIIELHDEGESPMNTSDTIETGIQVCYSGDEYCPESCSFLNDNDCKVIILNDFYSNNPEDYLGDYISFTPYSEWKQYYPLINKVDELTSSLNNDSEKAKAIATWVKNSRSYQTEEISVANYGGTVIDIFNEKEGVCLDAAILTTAMLRLAGIPARTTNPMWIPDHQTTQFYSEGHWQEVDSVFGTGEPSFFLEERFGFTENYYCEDDNSIYSISKPISTNEYYGNVTIPFLSYTPARSYDMNWQIDSGGKAGPDSSIVFANIIFFGLQQMPRNSSKKELTYTPKFCSENMSIAVIGGNYLLNTSLPTNTYRLTYSLKKVEETEKGFRVIDDDIAYVILDIRTNTTTKLTKDLFVKVTTNETEYLDFLNLISSFS